MVRSAKAGLGMTGGGISEGILRAGLAFILVGLFVVGYHTTLNWMYGRFSGADSYYSHGFLIPVVVAYLIWLQRDVLRSLQDSRRWTGLIIVGIGVFLHLAGTAFYVFSISGFSILFLVVGMVMYLWGEAVAKVLWFPLAYLSFMFPIPESFLTALSFPLKMQVSSCTVALVSSMGIPIFREGFYLHIPKGTLLVGNPCSGLRSLIAFLALGTVYAHLAQMSWRKTTVFAMATVPVALVSNVVRMTVLVFIAQFLSLEAAAPTSPLHDATGLLAFVVGLGLLWALKKAMCT